MKTISPRTIAALKKKASKAAKDLDYRLAKAGVRVA